MTVDHSKTKELDSDQSGGSFTPTDRLKYLMSSLIYDALSNTQNEESFVEAVQFLNNIEDSFFQDKFRKLNGLCLSIYSDTYLKYAPKEQMIIIQNLSKFGIQHSSIKRNLINYVSQIMPKCEEMRVVDLLALLQILNELKSTRGISRHYQTVFRCLHDLILIDGKFLSLSRFKFLLDTLKKSTEAATNNQYIIALVLDQMVSRVYKFQFLDSHTKLIILIGTL